MSALLLVDKGGPERADETLDLSELGLLCVVSLVAKDLPSSLALPRDLTDDACNIWKETQDQLIIFKQCKLHVIQG